jgi:hypothetical protein
MKMLGFLFVIGCSLGSYSAWADDEPQHKTQGRARQQDYEIFINFDRKCSDEGFDIAKWRPVIESAFREGIACQRKLGTKTAVDHERRLKALISNERQPLNFFCGASDPDIPFPSGRTDPNSKDFPSIAIPPELFLEATKDERETKSKLFHELFHNLGYKHGEGIDFPYLCDSCCFPDKGLSANDALKARTCEMCAGKTLDPNRRDYISNLTDAIDNSEGRGMTGFGYLTFHLASKFPKDPWFLYWSAYSAARMKDTKCLGLGIYRALRTQGVPLTGIEDLEHLLKQEDEKAITQQSCSRTESAVSDELGQAYLSMLRGDWRTSISHLQKTITPLDNLLGEKTASDSRVVKRLLHRFALNILLETLDQANSERDALDKKVKSYIFGSYQFSDKIRDFSRDFDGLKAILKSYGLNNLSRGQIIRIKMWYYLDVSDYLAK